MRDRKALIVEQIPRLRRYARALTGAQPLAPAEYLAGPAKIAILADYEGLVADVAARGGRCRRATSPLEPTNCSTDSGRRGEIQHHHPRRRIEAVGVDETLTRCIARLLISINGVIPPHRFLLVQCLINDSWRASGDVVGVVAPARTPPAPHPIGQSFEAPGRCGTLTRREVPRSSARVCSTRQEGPSALEHFLQGGPVEVIPPFGDRRVLARWNAGLGKN